MIQVAHSYFWHTACIVRCQLIPTGIRDKVHLLVTYLAPFICPSLLLFRPVKTALHLHGHRVSHVGECIICWYYNVWSWRRGSRGILDSDTGAFLSTMVILTGSHSTLMRDSCVCLIRLKSQTDTNVMWTPMLPVTFNMKGFLLQLR